MLQQNVYIHVFSYVQMLQKVRWLNDHANNSKTMNAICVRQADLVNNNAGAAT